MLKFNFWCLIVSVWFKFKSQIFFFFFVNLKLIGEVKLEIIIRLNLLLNHSQCACLGGRRELILYMLERGIHVLYIGICIEYKF